MIYDLDNKLDRKRFKARCKYLLSKDKNVELKEKRYNRTIRQNKYFYLIVTWYGLEIGYTSAEMKQIIKTEICAEVFSYRKNGNVFTKSSADLDTNEMTIVIDQVRNHAAQNGIHLPDPNEQEQLRSMEEQLSRYGNRQYI